MTCNPKRVAVWGRREVKQLPFENNITWTEGPDTERPGYRITTGAPAGLPGYQIIVQDVGDDEFGWLLLDAEATPVQMRNGYKERASAQKAVYQWLRVNRWA